MYMDAPLPFIFHWTKASMGQFEYFLLVVGDLEEWGHTARCTPREGRGMTVRFTVANSICARTRNNSRGYKRTKKSMVRRVPFIVPRIKANIGPRLSCHVWCQKRVTWKLECEELDLFQLRDEKWPWYVRGSRVYYCEKHSRAHKNRASTRKKLSSIDGPRMIPSFSRYMFKFS